MDLRLFIVLFNDENSSLLYMRYVNKSHSKMAAAIVVRCRVMFY